MSNSVQNVNTVKSGLCPHGMSPGACPICSGMGGGSSRVGERPQKPGEMSYHECAMIGAMMRARAESLKAHEQNLKLHAENLKQFEQKMQTCIQNLSKFLAIFSANRIPIVSIPMKAIGFVLNSTIMPIMNFIKNIPKIIQKFIDIQDKLNAIFGEAKAFLDKKISELISTIKTKNEWFFKIFKKNKTDDDDTKIDEDKKIFNLKTVLYKIKKRFKKDDRKIESEP